MKTKIEGIIIAAFMFAVLFLLPAQIVGWTNAGKIIISQVLIMALFALCLAAFYRDGD